MTTEQQYIHIDAYGNKRTYKDRDMKILHCAAGPAFEYSDGTKIWYLNNKCHRIDGPAVEYSDGTKEWYLDGKRFTEKEFNAVTAPTIELTLEDIATKFGVDINKLKIVK